MLRWWDVQSGECVRVRKPGLSLLYASRLVRLSSGNEAIRVQHVFFGGSFVKVLVPPRRILQSDDGGVDRPGNLHLVVAGSHFKVGALIPTGNGLRPSCTPACQRTASFLKTSLPTDCVLASLRQAVRSALRSGKMQGVRCAQLVGEVVCIHSVVLELVFENVLNYEQI